MSTSRYGHVDETLILTARAMIDRELKLAMPAGFAPEPIVRAICDQALLATTSCCQPPTPWRYADCSPAAPDSLVAQICPQSKDGRVCDAHRSGDSRD